MAASKQSVAMRASSRNHNHTRTALQGRTAPTSHSRPNTHNTHPTQHNNIAHRLDMHLPPTPPAEDIGKLSAPAGGGSGGGAGPEPPRTPPAKFGVSPSAPSFASVVSSSTAARSSARSPLSTTSPHQQKQEQAQAHTSAAPLDHTMGDNSPAAPAVAGGASAEACAQSSSPKEARVKTSNAESQGEEQNDLEDSESSDVEIYLNTLGLHDSAARMHVFGGPGDTSAAPIRPSMTTTQPSDDSTTTAIQFGGPGTNVAGNANTLRLGGADLTSTKSLSPLSFAVRSSNGSPSSVSHLRTLQPPYTANSTIGTSKSPQLPAAPVHSTIPLPHIDDKDYLQEADAQQLQQLQQHQKQQDQYQQQPASVVPSIVHNNGTIDLAGLSIGASVGGDASVRGQQQLGLPTAHSQPVLTIDPPFTPRNDVYGNIGSNLPTSVSDSALGAVGQKTPNVYINGLPPHFREDQLFDLTCPFGAIRSVRTFTRHVRDSESGYGFVLFETIEAAERCIISLRRYRNLHPTFSKQIHKIPGTTYAQGAMAPSSTATTWNELGLDSDSGSNGGSNADSLGQDASFKAKMETLQDPTSTNLYMEGLPLSLDEPTLAALVAPHTIISSRFFHTRLSNPPRIIAFVRLDTRKGAEEIIERLHGRMVRGLNDAGSRISVRFADTSEQRELRRMERSAQEGDASPARLTIAQAALLNLRGKDLGPTSPGTAGYGLDAGRLPSATSRGFGTSVSAPDFASNTHLTPELEVDYSLAPGRSALGHASSRARSPYQTQNALGYQQPDLYANQSQGGYGHSPTAPVDPAMAALINSLGNASLSYQGGGGAYGDGNHSGLEVDQLQAARGLGYPTVGHHHAQFPTSISAENIHQYARPAPAYTRSGYTPTEEYIMRAHAESAALAHAQAQQQQQQHAERRRPAPLDLRRRRGDESEYAAANIAVGMRGYRAQASVGRIGQGLMSPTTPMGTLPSSSALNGMGMGSLGEDDFQASVRNEFGRALNSTAGSGDGEINRTVGSATHARHNPNIHPAHVNARLGRDQQPPASAPSTVTSYGQMQRSPLPLSPLLPQTAAAQASSVSGAGQESPNISQTISYQHAAHMRSTTLPQHRTSSARDGQQMGGGAARGHYQHSSMSMPAQSLRTPQHASVAAFGNAGGTDGGGPGSGTIYEDGPREDEQQQAQQQQQQHMETSSSTGSLISPTLTYGTQTPSTLSPATPFFGSFSQSENFEKGVNEGHHQNGPGATPLRS